MAKPSGANVELLENVSVSMPYLIPEAAEKFNQLRELVKRETGIDFLSILGDAMRSRGFTTNKPGVAKKSFHQAGRAFDYNQAAKELVLKRDDKGGRTYWRTYLKRKDGSLFDFTAAAESLGWRRIPAQTGWANSWNKREFWHMQYNPKNLTWEQAMAEAYPPTADPKTPIRPLLKLGSRGVEVELLQCKLGIMVDGNFGSKTAAAVEVFQKANGLTADAIVGKNTWAKLENL